MCHFTAAAQLARGQLSVANEKPPKESITGLLLAAERGDHAALQAVFPLVYKELRALAQQQRQRWHGNPTLNTTALVHEAYLKLVDQKRIGATSRAHFFAIAATAMRHILCNYARDRSRKKRGGEIQHVSLGRIDEAASQPVFSEDAAETLAALADALERLDQIDKRQSQVVECRFFAGLSVEDTAAALDISPATVKRDWTQARAWLYREMKSHAPSA